MLGLNLLLMLGGLAVRSWTPAPLVVYGCVWLFLLNWSWNPRFKKWSPTERFPWGWSQVQTQLHERLARR